MRTWILLTIIALLFMTGKNKAQVFNFTHHEISNAIPGARMIDAGDIDGDGDYDFAVTGWVSNGKVSLLLNDGSQYLEQIIDSALSYPHDVKMVDLDQDGDLDLVVSRYGDGRLHWYENDNMSFTRHLIARRLNNLNEIVVVDFDNDGDLDVLAAERNSDFIRYFVNDGNQNFTRQDIPAGVGTWGLRVVDLDQDGDADILATRPDNDDVIWLRNENYASYTLTILKDSMDFCFDVYDDDIDQDGDIDIIVNSGNGGEMYILSNDGNQNFSEILIDNDLYGADNIGVGDFNGDGYKDIVCTAFADTVTDGLFIYDGADNFHKYGLIVGEQGAGGVVVFDNDQDGDLDIASAYFTNGKVILSENEPFPSALSRFGEYPTDFVLEQNYPNPFNPSTTIRYRLPATMEVKLQIYNSEGKHVRTITHGVQASGFHQVTWDGRDDYGRPVVSGIYFYRLQTGSKGFTRKMILMK